MTNGYTDAFIQLCKLLSKGVVHGMRFGMKTRIPHTAVNQFFINYDQGSYTSKLNLVFEKTKEHCLLLAKWITLYKILLVVFRTSEKRKSSQWHQIVSGLIGGWYIWGNWTPIIQQINLYVFGRVLNGLYELALQKELFKRIPNGNGYRLFSSLIWASVMWLFVHHRAQLSKSLTNAMDFLYVKSNINQV